MARCHIHKPGKNWAVTKFSLRFAGHVYLQQWIWCNKSVLKRHGLTNLQKAGPFYVFSSLFDCTLTPWLLSEVTEFIFPKGEHKFIHILGAHEKTDLKVFVIVTPNKGSLRKKVEPKICFRGAIFSEWLAGWAPARQSFFLCDNDKERKVCFPMAWVI